MDRPGQIVIVLHDHRLIQPHHFSQAFNGGLVHMFTQPWLALAPCIAIMIVVLAFNFLGDGLRDVLDLSLIHI